MATIADFIIRVKTDGQAAVDRMRKSIDDTEKSANKTNDALNKFSGAIGDLGNNLRASSGLNNQFTDSLENIGGSFGRVGTGVATVIAAFGLWAVKSANTAYELQQLSNATGITAGQLMSLKQSVVAAGGSVSDFEAIATKLNTKLGQAAQGNQDLRKTFRELGVDLGDANGNLRRTDQLLPEIITALQKIEDPAKRAAMAVKLFEETGGKIDITKLQAVGNLEFDRQIKELAEYRQKWEEFANFVELKLLKTFLDLKDAIRDVFKSAPTGQGKNPLDVLFAPAMIGSNMAIKSNVEALGAGGGRGGQGGPTLQNLIDAGIVPGPKATGALALTKEQQNAIALIKDQTRAIEIRNKLQDNYVEAVQKQIGVEQNLAAMENQIAAAYRDNQLAKLALEQQIAAERRKGDETSPAIIKSLQEQISLADKLYNSTVRRAQNERDIRDTLRAQALELQRNAERFQDFLGLMAAAEMTGARRTFIGGGMSSAEYAAERELITFRQQAATEMARIDAQMLVAQAANAGAGDQILIDSLEKRKKALTDFLNAREYLVKENLRLDLEMAQSVVRGNRDFLEQLAAMTTPYQKIMDQNNAVFGAMSRTIDNFVETGTLKFRDFARDVIKELLKIELKASMAAVWQGLGGFTGLLAGVGKLFGFADGGRPPLDQPSIVGERGPELFMPRTAGTIIPNHALAGVGGTQQVVNNYNYNISAVDSRSVAQLFMENRRTLLGVTEQARKELPIRQRF